MGKGHAFLAKIVKFVKNAHYLCLSITFVEPTGEKFVSQVLVNVFFNLLVFSNNDKEELLNDFNFLE